MSIEYKTEVSSYLDSNGDIVKLEVARIGSYNGITCVKDATKIYPEGERISPKNITKEEVDSVLPENVDAIIASAIADSDELVAQSIEYSSL